MKKIIFSFLLLAVFSSSSFAFAHGGGLDSYGCHNNRKQGGYHCHRGQFAGQSFSSKAEMLQATQKSTGKVDKENKK